MINELHSIKAKVYSPVKMNTTLNAGIAKPEAGLRERVDEVEKQVEDLQLFDEEVSKALKQQDENTQTIVNKIVEIDEKDETQDQQIKDLQDKTSDLESFDQEVINKIKEYDKHIEDTESTIKEIKDKNDSQDELIEQINKSITDLQTENENQDRSIELLEEQTVNLEKQNENQDVLIENLQNQIVELEAENENLKNQIPTGQAEGENITLNDSSNMEFKELIIGGNSWQEKRNGYNILNPEAEYRKNFIYNEDSDTFTTSGQWIDYLFSYGSLKLKPNTSYTFYMNVIENSLTAAFNLVTGASSYLEGYFSIAPGETGIKTGILKTGSEAKLYDLWLNCTDKTNKLKAQIMLVEGEYTATTIPPYEKYGATPTPEIPSPIRNVGDNVNLYDKDNPNILNTPIDGNGLGVNAGDTYKTVYIKCDPNETYTVSKKYDATKNRFAVAYVEKEPTYSMQVLGYTLGTEKSELTIKTGANAKYLLAYVWITGGTTTYQEMLDSIKIEKGTKATPYSPYNCGNFNETICNKNLFDSKVLPELSGTTYGVEVRIDEEGVITVYDNVNSVGYFSSRTELKYLCPALKVGDVAYLHLETTHKTKGIWLLGESLMWNADTSKTITQEMLDGSIGIYGGNEQTDTLKIMVTLDKLATEYQPHESQQYTFPLKPGQRMYKDSYLADDGVHHKRGQEVLTLKGGVITLNNGNQAIPCRLSNKTSKYNYMLICSNAMFDKNAILLKDGTVYENPTNIVLVGNSTDTLETLKTKYENGIVEYELAEEIIEPYTEEQQKAYDKIKKAHSYKNVTHIFSTDETSPIIDVTYRKDLETMFNNINNAILGGN